MTGADQDALADEPNRSRHLVGRGSTYTIATALQLVSSLTVLPLVTRYLGPSAFGVVATALVVSQLGTYAAGLGLPSTATREYFAKPSDGLGHARRLVAAAIAIAAAICLTAAVTASWWGPAIGLGSSTSAAAVAALIPLPSAAVIGAQGILLAQDRPRPFVLLAVISTVGGQVIGLGALAFLDGSDGPTRYLAGLLTGWSLAAVVGVALTGVLGAGLPSARVLRAGLAVSAPTVVHASSALVLNLGDRVVLERVASEAAVGRYQVAYQMGTLGLSIVAALNNAWAPLIYREPEETRWAVLRTTSVDVTRLAVPLAGGLALGAPIALWVLVPADFGRAALVPVVAVTALSTLPYVWYLSGAHVLFQRGRTRPLAVITPAVALLNLVLVAVSYEPFGLVGAGAATFVSYVAWAAAVRWAAGRLVVVHWARSVELHSAALATLLVVAGAVMGIAWPAMAVRVVLIVALAAALVVGLRRAMGARG